MSLDSSSSSSDDEDSLPLDEDYPEEDESFSPEEELPDSSLLSPLLDDDYLEDYELSPSDFSSFNLLLSIAKSIWLSSFLSDLTFRLPS